MAYKLFNVLQGHLKDQCLVRLATSRFNLQLLAIMNNQCMYDKTTNEKENIKDIFIYLKS